MKKSKKEKSGRKSFFAELSDEMRTHKVTFWVYVILRFVVIGFTVFSAFRGQWENVFTCVLTLPFFLCLSQQLSLTRSKITMPRMTIVLIMYFTRFTSFQRDYPYGQKDNTI